MKYLDVLFYAFLCYINYNRSQQVKISGGLLSITSIVDFLWSSNK